MHAVVVIPLGGGRLRAAALHERIVIAPRPLGLRERPVGGDQEGPRRDGVVRPEGADRAGAIHDLAVVHRGLVAPVPVHGHGAGNHLAGR